MPFEFFNLSFGKIQKKKIGGYFNSSKLTTQKHGFSLFVGGLFFGFELAVGYSVSKGTSEKKKILRFLEESLLHLLHLLAFEAEFYFKIG